MRGYLNKASLGVGATLGAAGNSVAATNVSDTIVELLPLIVELAIVVALLGIVFGMMKQIKV